MPKRERDAVKESFRRQLMRETRAERSQEGLRDEFEPALNRQFSSADYR
jgi:hypothetical protein